jgi:hypothetical protein
MSNAESEEQLISSSDEKAATLRRLEPTGIYPFHRASSIKTISTYWIGGFEYPMPFSVRLWFFTFFNLLKEAMASREFRQENFMRFRIVAEMQSERFLQTSLEYQPLAGYAIPPDGTMVKPPTTEDIEKAIKNGGFKLQDWVGDYTYWFLKQQDERQRQDFFGLGGMMFLWLKPDPNTIPPDLDIPGPAQRYLDEQGQDLAATARDLYRLQDSFLEKSKQVFGAPLHDDPSYSGIPFVLPLLQARHFLEASPETLEKWFEVFNGYLIESREDTGVLLAVADPDFDPVLLSILKQMREGGTKWPFEEKKLTP